MTPYCQPVDRLELLVLATRQIDTVPRSLRPELVSAATRLLADLHTIELPHAPACIDVRGLTCPAGATR